MRKVFYGWQVLGGLFILMAISIGITVNSFSFFYKPVVTDLGFTYGDFSLTSSIAALTAMLGCILVAKLLGRVDLRVIVTVATIVYAASLALDGLARNLHQFYVLAAFTGLGYAGIGGVAVSQVVTNWFRKRQGLAMAIAMAGSGVGGLIFSPLIEALIRAYGWRSAFVILAVIIIVVTLPVSIFVIRLSPEQKGLRAYGEEEAKVDTSEVDGTTEGLTLTQARKSWNFWGLCLTNFIAGLLVMAVQMHGPVAMQVAGLSSTRAALVMALCSVVLIPGKLLFGFIHDRFGSAASAFYIFGAFIVTLIGLLVLKDFTTALAYGVLFGLSGAITTLSLPLWTVSSFGRRDYALIFSIMSVAMTLGAAVGPPLAGYIYDSAGSYAPAWYILIGAAFLGLVVTFLAVRKKRKAPAD